VRVASIAPSINCSEIEIASRRIGLWKPPGYQIGERRIKLGKRLAEAAGGHLWRDVAGFNPEAHDVYPEVGLWTAAGARPPRGYGEHSSDNHASLVGPRRHQTVRRRNHREVIYAKYPFDSFGYRPFVFDTGSLRKVVLLSELFLLPANPGHVRRWLAPASLLRQSICATSAPPFASVRQSLPLKGEANCRSLPPRGFCVSCASV
jgi:hypothetical protein